MTDPDNSREEIHLRLDTPPPCTRCEGPALLLARFPHAWTNCNGRRVAGLRESTLCPICDRGKSDAEALLQLLMACGELDATSFESLGGLAAAWVESLRQEYVDIELLNSEHEQWQRGDL
ncbi:DUF6300 family protein [Streptomyces sp. BK340]|uniref:DUF6300 family protein n=1 Tax=Streptomyces sp. BK340 TaxID=2572903 RepID=UPI0011A1C91E|nr:DUF6300 family protein [Streptomyces sp. BK340]TVZ90490.1 hypothetical protein FB157_111148 [Streptomyces sp. BK340]